MEREGLIVRTRDGRPPADPRRADAEGRELYRRLKVVARNTGPAPAKGSPIDQATCGGSSLGSGPTWEVTVQTDVQIADASDTDGVVIRTQELTKVYDTGVTAVDHLDLEVREGEIFGLLGPNGAGKTTTVGMLTTRVIPTEGRATVAGVDVVAHPSEAKALMGVVSQTNTLDRSLTVWENLYFHGRYFGMGRRSRSAWPRRSWRSSGSPTAPKRRSPHSPAAWPNG